METAREMIRESLPIKCLEAVILGMYPLALLTTVLLLLTKTKTIKKNFLLIEKHKMKSKYHIRNF